MKKQLHWLSLVSLVVMVSMLAACAPAATPAPATEAPAAPAAPAAAAPAATDAPAAAPAASDAKKEMTIGFIPMTLDNEYFITMVNAAKQEAEKEGVKLNVQAGTSHGSAEEQLQIVETMITNKVDAICIVPSSSVGLMTALKKAEEAGIPVVNLDTRLDPDLVKTSGLKPVPFIGTNNYDGAKLAGEYALKLTGGKGKVAILTGIAGQQNAADRRNGFYDVVKGKLDVVAEASADWEVEKGYNAAQNMIQANPDIVLIFASNDNMGLGAIRAAKEAGKDIKVIGYDAVAEALNSVKSGEMAGTIAQFPAEMGIQGVKAAISLKNGGSMPDLTYTETRPITKDNVEEFMTYLAKFK
jgi:ribose transport system substrate-binding protein